MKNSLEILLRENNLLKDLENEHLKLLSGCAKNEKIDAEKYLFKEMQEAEKFYLVRKGKIALEMYIPQKGRVIIQTLEDGDILGWSWLIPPFNWHFDSRAISQVRLISFDAKCLRTKCEKDKNFGYEIMKRIAYLMETRLEATRLQLLDLYGKD